MIDAPNNILIVNHFYIGFIQTGYLKFSIDHVFILTGKYGNNAVFDL